MYGTIIRETGWTVRQLERQPVADVFDLLAHMADEPPAYVTLAAVHLDQSKRKSRTTTINETEQRAEMTELAAMFGQRPMPITPDVAHKLDEIARLEALFKKHPETLPNA